MRKAYINGVEVTILQFYQDNKTPTCKVKVNSSGWIIDTPTSMIEIR